MLCQLPLLFRNSEINFSANNYRTVYGQNKTIKIRCSYITSIPIDLLEFLATQKCSIGLNYVFAES